MRRPADFEQAVRRGVRAGRDALVVHLAGDDGPARMGFVVSKQVGTAVTRNRVKRRLRAIGAAHLGELPDGALVVVRALPAAAGSDFRDLERQLVSALETTRRRAAGRVVAP